MSVTTKFITGAAIAATLVATVAVARTMQHRTTAAEPASYGSTDGAAVEDYARARRHGLVACPAIVETNCDALELMLPQ